MARRRHWLLTALVVGVVAGGVALPIVNGQRAEQAWVAGIETVDAMLEQDYGRPNGVESQVYDRGLFSAQAQARIRLAAPAVSPALAAMLGNDRGEVVLTLEQTIEHGLLGIRFDGHLIPQDRLAEQLGRFAADPAEAVRVGGKVNLQMRQLRVSTLPLSGLIEADEPLVLDAAPLRLELSFEPDEKRLDTLLDWPGMTLDAPEQGGELRVDEVSLNSTGRLVAGDLLNGLWVGRSELRVGDMAARSPMEPPIRLAELSVTANSEAADNGRIDAGLGLRFSRLSLPEFPVVRGQARWQLRSLAAEPLMALSRMAPALEDSPTLPRQARAYLADLAAAGPVLTLESMRLETEAGTGLSSTGRVTVDPAMAEALRAGTRGMALLRHLDMTAAMGLDQSLGDALPAEPAAWLAQLQAFGIVRRQAGEYRIEAALERGTLTINDRPWWRLDG